MFCDVPSSSGNRGDLRQGVDPSADSGSLSESVVDTDKIGAKSSN